MTWRTSGAPGRYARWTARGASRITTLAFGADAQVTDVVATKRVRSPARRRPQRVIEVHVHVAHGDGENEAPCSSRTTCPGCSPSPARRRAPRRAVAAPMSTSRARREVRAGKDRRDGPRRAKLLDVVVAEDTCSDRRSRRRVRPRARRRRSRRVDCRGREVRDPRLRRPLRIARDSSTSKAPRSQKTSAHFDFGAQASSIASAHEVHVAVAVVAVLRRHDVGAEERDLVAELTGDVEQS